jgi:exonuclease VII small subunit
LNQKQRDLIDKWISTLEEIRSLAEDMQGEESEKFDNMSEGLQQTERGLAVETARDELESAVDSLQSVIDNLENAKGS